MNGAARCTESGEVLQHLPFKAVRLGESASLLPLGQKISASLGVASGAALAVSTVAVMGTIIACTVYLARKLDRLQQKIDVIERELQGQNMLFYADKITGYFGALESLRELMLDPETANENADLIVHKLAMVGALRCELYSFSDNLPHMAAQVTPHHQSLAVDFVLETVNLLPKGVYLETAAAYRIGRIRLGDTIREASRKKHTRTLEQLRRWANDSVKAIANGDPRAVRISEHREAIRNVLDSEENTLLLTLSA